MGKQPLPSVEEILRKRAAGEKLSRAEAGKIGGAFRGGRKPPEPNQPAPTVRRLPVADGMEAPGSPVVLAAPPVDPDLCKQTAGEILDTLNEAGQASLATKAKRIAAGEADAKRFLEIGALKPGARTTMVNTSPSWLPKLLRVAGLDPQNAPEAMAGVAALMWGVGYFRAAGALDKLAKEKESAAREVAKAAKPEKEASGTKSP